MKISIITVCFNSETTIEQTIQSVISQSYFSNVEYIIIDAQSSDNTLNIIEKYSRYISVFISEKDRGIYDAMNKGISIATGDVIGILNSDDLYFDSTVIEDVFNFFTTNVGIDILYGNIVYVKKNNTVSIVRKWISTSYYDSFFEDGHVPPHPSLFLRNNVYKKVGHFDLRYKLAADYEFMLRLFKGYKFKSQYLNRNIVRMRLGGATNNSFSNILKGNKEIMDAWKNNRYKLPYLLFMRRLIMRLVQFVK